MMCQRFKKDMLMELYGELESKRRRRLERHLAACAACRREFEATRDILTLLGSTEFASAPEPDWDRSWEKIEAGLDLARPVRMPFITSSRWVYTSVALVVLFVVGIIVGRYILPSRTGIPAESHVERLSPTALRTVLSSYFEAVTPLLLDYAHYSPIPAKNSVFLSDQKAAESLLVENMLLRRALAPRDQVLAKIFEDLDLILTDISHLKNGDAWTSALLKDAIKNRQVLDRIRRFEKL